jgi:geranylgeranyl pyrophosphate synthase
LGKTPGKDERAGKSTLVVALGLDGARARARELAQAAHQRAVALGGARPAGLAVSLVDELLLRRS